MPLGKRTDCGDAKYAGLEVPFAADIAETLQSTLLCGFDFMVMGLVQPSSEPPLAAASKAYGRDVPYGTHSDLLLSSNQWSNQVVGKVSQWIEPDAEAETLSHDSGAALKRELGWAAHLGLQACMVQVPLQTRDNARFACILNQVASGLSSMALWLRIPFQSSVKADAEHSGGVGVEPWERWNQVRTLCNSHPKLGLVLDVPADIPDRAEVARWRGEPVKALVVPTAIFVTNKRGYPTLSKPHQELLSLFIMQGVQIILSGSAPEDASFSRVSSSTSSLQDAGGPFDPPRGPATSGDVIEAGPAPGAANGSEHSLRVYWEYLSFLFRKQDAISQQEQAEFSYRDYLQAPLQPLQDNLESQTYETFEKDTMKYQTYGEAVYQALLDRVPESEAGSRETVLMVVGAGRGPLVRASLAAAARAGRKLRVYAVEKNPNAVVTLQNLVASEGWEDVVTIVAADMRHWTAPAAADILVSELLGSFGDNELSPECLDGAQRFLKPGGISIPAAYTSYLQPVTANKLWNDVKAYNDLEHFETPYVVKLHRTTLLADTQPVFTFLHPTPQPADNARSARLHFTRKGCPAAICHGFAGYFDAQLYKDVHLSTVPASHTPDMFSWFPIFFPLREPVYLPAGADMQLHMWRCISPHRVWYEWAVLQPLAQPIHNTGGRSYYVGL